MFVGYTYLWFPSPTLNVYMLLLAVTLISQSSMHQNWGRKTLWGLYVSSFGVSKMTFYLPFWNQLITTRTTKEHLCNNCFLCQAQSFLSYLLSLMNHEQLARNYFNYMKQWCNTCFVVGSTSLHASLQESINALLRACGFKRKFLSKNIITKPKLPWKVQLKWPWVPL